MLAQLQQDYRKQGAAHIPGFLAPEQLQQFTTLLAEVHWLPRRYCGIHSEVPDPGRHGLLTGRINEFLSQPPLLEQFEAITGKRAVHFAGNFGRLDHDQEVEWREREGLDAIYALVVSLGPESVRVGNESSFDLLGAGDGVLMSLNARGFRAAGPAIFIEGYYLGE